MNDPFPTADDYAAERARFAPRTVVDLRAVGREVTGPYRNQVVVDVNRDCLRLSVFEGEYRGHCHPDSDELVLVVDGEMRIEFDDGHAATLTPGQSLVVPAGTIHRTSAIGRTVNVTFEAQGARTVFLDAPPKRDPG